MSDAKDQFNSILLARDGYVLAHPEAVVWRLRPLTFATPSYQPANSDHPLHPLDPVTFSAGKDEELELSVMELERWEAMAEKILTSHGVFKCKGLTDDLECRTCLSVFDDQDYGSFARHYYRSRVALNPLWGVYSDPVELDSGFDPDEEVLKKIKAAVEKQVPTGFAITEEGWQILT